jgi:hypothetical protein
MPAPISRIGPTPLAPPSALHRPRPSGGGGDLPPGGLATVIFEDTFGDRTLPLLTYGSGAGDNWGDMSDGVHAWSIFVAAGAGKFAGVVAGYGVGKHEPTSGDVLNVSTDTGLLPVHFQVDAVVRVGPAAAIMGTSVVNLNLHMHSGDLIGHLQIQRNAGVLEKRLILENAGALGAFSAFVADVDYLLRWEYNSIGAPNVERAKLWLASDPEPGAWDVEGVPTDPTPGNEGNERVVWQFGGALPAEDLFFEVGHIRATVP